MKAKCTDCGIHEAVSGDELCEECRESHDEPIPNPLIPAIERVIAELEKEFYEKLEESNAKVETTDSEVEAMEYFHAKALNDYAFGIKFAINKLKEAITTETTQIRSKENDSR
jgi:hypothetical protein